MCRSTVWSGVSTIENSGRSASVFKTAAARASMTPKAPRSPGDRPVTQRTRQIQKKPLARGMHRGGPANGWVGGILTSVATAEPIRRIGRNSHRSDRPGQALRQAQAHEDPEARSISAYQRIKGGDRSCLGQPEAAARRPAPIRCPEARRNAASPVGQDQQAEYLFVIEACFGATLVSREARCRHQAGW